MGGSLLLSKWDMLSWSFMKLDFLKSAVCRIVKVITFIDMPLKKIKKSIVKIVTLEIKY